MDEWGDSENSPRSISSISVHPRSERSWIAESGSGPGDANWREVAIRVAGLLSHYWTANDDQATRRAQIADWTEDLREFPLGAIEGAMITWRRNQTRRPTPADIRKLILPDPVKHDDGGNAARQPFQQSRLTLMQLEKHRNAVAPLWDLVRGAQQGEDPEMLIAERHRMSAAIFAADPELREINELIKREQREERERERQARA